MRRILKKIKFTVITILMIFSLVASNAVNHHQVDANAQWINECLMVDEKDCDALATAPRIPTISPDIGQSDKEKFLAAIANNLATIPQPGSYEYILLKAYGTAFINRDKLVTLPSTVLLNNEEETQTFQNSLTMVKVNGTNDCYLQASATAALNQARSLENIPLKSGYGSGDCTRSFATNFRFWNKYANQNTLNQVKEGRETAILGVVAPPGTSQHLWGLAIDLRVSHLKQRQILNQNGWFQTVAKDVPHWTYLGLNEQDLLNFGLRKQVENGISYWVTPL
ncbi:D-alanyl-D-alanine carboxypeptidase family protein [Anabaena sp. UHCC 0399]|uniref:D-alanyl-D-alanine carboxypeptidase family protein n=1 Tax=Anabaena sp. UHCC 0399 TaxID=3110238 RepID=UPI002B20374D|nr:D-alanyl-D-alanine carboxypeptidase family protein [Anabaena sp. UHCC 0399]MEA5568363.1 D-alanyl-D-alanine carboxypeptidase family protein [Anabaena sp. UHCC 0399]